MAHADIMTSGLQVVRQLAVDAAMARVRIAQANLDAMTFGRADLLAGMDDRECRRAAMAAGAALVAADTALARLLKASAAI